MAKTEVLIRAESVLAPRKDFFKNSKEHIDRLLAAIEPTIKALERKKKITGYLLRLPEGKISGKMSKEKEDNTINGLIEEVDHLKYLATLLDSLESLLGNEYVDAAENEPREGYVDYALTTVSTLVNSITEKHKDFSQNISELDRTISEQAVLEIEGAISKIINDLKDIIVILSKSRPDLHIHREEIIEELKEQLGKYFKEKKEELGERVDRKVSAVKGAIWKQFRDSLSDFPKAFTPSSNLSKRRQVTLYKKYQLRAGPVENSYGLQISDESSGKNSYSNAYISLFYDFLKDEFICISHYEDGITDLWGQFHGKKLETLIDKGIVSNKKGFIKSLKFLKEHNT